MKRLLLGLLTLLGTASAGSLSGALIIAADGTFLGDCGGAYGRMSISNTYSQYGNEYGTHSMFNPYGQYGSKYAMYSPFNEYGQPAYLLSGTPALVELFTSPTSRPSASIVSALRSSGATRITASASCPGGVDPNVLRVACRTP
ncbi:hypothetical protein [Deinococcus sonorensis]|uniref:Uncharacterized protein n=1 Tax=Deinococcus sonorensis TaxID=309891 RepID=A0ABV8Y841_9DEIO